MVFNMGNKLLILKRPNFMVFNRRNKLLKVNIHLNNVLLENVKSFKYLGFSISAKNCSFSKILEGLSMKAYQAIFPPIINLSYRNYLLDWLKLLKFFFMGRWSGVPMRISQIGIKPRLSKYIHSF